MMSIGKFDKISPVIAINGPVDTDEIYAEYAENGLVDEVVRYKAFNKIAQLSQVKANDILENGIAMGDQGIDTEILEGRMSSSRATSHGLAASNRYNIGSSTTRFSRIWPTRIAGVQKCLAIDCQTYTEVPTSGSTLLYVIDRDTGTVVTHDLVTGFDPASGPWALKGVCSDGTYVYVAAINGGADVNYWVQCFDMVNWTVRVGWPAYGVAASSNGGAGYPVDLIIANETYLAISDWDLGYAVNLVYRSDGTLGAKGNGDLTPTTEYCYGLRSNGTYLFFAANSKICSASIANPTVGCGGTNWPYTTSGVISRIACRGDLVAACHWETSAIVEVARVQNAKYQTITLTTNTPYANGVAFDDCSLWIRASRLVGSTRRQILVQCANQTAIPEDSTVVHAMNLPTGDSNDRVFDVDLVHPTAPDGMDMHWDGRDLWIPGEATATATAFNPYVFRYPHTRNNRGILY